MFAYLFPALAAVLCQIWRRSKAKEGVGYGEEKYRTERYGSAIPPLLSFPR
jgi:hypothetical protein